MATVSNWSSSLIITFSMPAHFLQCAQYHNSHYEWYSERSARVNRRLLAAFWSAPWSIMPLCMGKCAILMSEKVWGNTVTLEFRRLFSMIYVSEIVDIPICAIQNSILCASLILGFWGFLVLHKYDICEQHRVTNDKYNNYCTVLYKQLRNFQNTRIKEIHFTRISQAFKW